MKSISIIVFFTFLSTSFALSQSFHDQLSYNDFQEWAENQEIEGYSFLQTEELPDEDYGKDEYYSAFYDPDDKSTKLVITITEPHVFTVFYNDPKYKDRPTFDLGGHTAVYLPDDKEYSTSMLWVEMPEINATLMILKSPMKKKDELVSIYEKLDFTPIVTD